MGEENLFLENTSFIKVVYSVMQSSTVISRRPSMIAIKLQYMSVQTTELSIAAHKPARAGASHDIKDMTWLDWRQSTLFTIVVEFVHDFLQHE